MFDFNEVLTQMGIPPFGKYSLPLLGSTLLLLIIFVAMVEKLRKNRNRYGRNESTAQIEQEDLDDGSENDHTMHIPYVWSRYSNDKMNEKAVKFYQEMQLRRTIRSFSSEQVPRNVIETILKTAGTSPSGAHQQPWTYVLVSSPQVKQQIRFIVEKEEEVNYKRRMGEEWVNSLKQLQTNWNKPYITDAPHIILVFKQLYSLKPDGTKRVHYYSEHSVSISVGLLLAAIHKSGLYSLISTPLNCGPALSTLLNRPINEKLLYLMPIGLPADECRVPDLTRKNLRDIAIFV